MEPMPNDSQVSKAKANMESLQIPEGKDLRAPEAGVPASWPTTPPKQTVPTVLAYNEGLFSGTESEMTQEEQLDFTTPVSSRAETPPPANANDLSRCVTIMQQIAAQDIVLLKELTSVRKIAAKLRRRARDVRELVKAENGRRERMETFFRYWQEVEPNWDRRWVYEENTAPNDKGSNKVPPAPGRKPELSPEEVRKRRQEIISRQEAEQQELEALRQREMHGRKETDECSGELALVDDEREMDLVRDQLGTGEASPS